MSNKGDKDMQAAIIERNVTSTKGLIGKAKERTVKLQRATGITEELRVKLDAADGLHIGYGDQNRPMAHNLVQVPIDYYLKQGWITDREYEAGKEFHKLWFYGAVKTGFAQMKYTAQPRIPSTPESGKVLAEKYQKAKLAIKGLVQALFCYNVCCMGEWVNNLKPEDLNNELIGKNRRMGLLRAGLKDLANHFRLPHEMAASRSSSGSSGAEDSGKQIRNSINLNKC